MKQIFIALLSLIFLISLTACSISINQTGSENTQIANPMVAKESLEEINSAIGSSIVKPSEDVTNERFYLISDSIGEYDFTLNGISYTLRVAQTEDDISGIYVGNTTIGKTIGEGMAVCYEGGQWMKQFKDGIQYSLASDYKEGLTEEIYSVMAKIF